MTLAAGEAQKGECQYHDKERERADDLCAGEFHFLIVAGTGRRRQKFTFVSVKKSLDT